jgi:hypothetical protein
MTKAKCISGMCGWEFENENENVFFDTVVDDRTVEENETDVLFKFDVKTFGCYGYVFCPLCGAKCIQI